MSWRLLLAAAVMLPAAARAQDVAPETVSEILGLEVRQLLADTGAGRNDASPNWAPGGKLLAFERAEESRREIVIANREGAVVRTVYYQTDESDLGLGALLPGLGSTVSYNAGISWSPQADRFVFMSNAGEGNYDLYLGTLASKTVQRLTNDPQKDGQPDWSPTGSAMVFVSGRSGSAQLYLMDMDNRKTVRVSNGDKSYLYPRWSPDGKRIAAIYGANENHDIVVIDQLTLPAKPQVKAGDANKATPAPEPSTPSTAETVKPVERRLTTWAYDDLSPSWSPDGKRLAFYSNQNPQNDPKVWSLLVLEADGSGPTEGEALVARVIARNVIPDIAAGPAWLPDSRRLAYVRNDKQDYSPIYVTDIVTRKTARLVTQTNINHDLAISSDGVLAFRAQVDQWDRIFLVGLPKASE